MGRGVGAWYARSSVHLFSHDALRKKHLRHAMVLAQAAISCEVLPLESNVRSDNRGRVRGDG